MNRGNFTFREMELALRELYNASARLTTRYSPALQEKLLENLIRYESFIRKLTRQEASEELERKLSDTVNELVSPKNKKEHMTISEMLEQAARLEELYKTKPIKWAELMGAAVQKVRGTFIPANPERKSFATRTQKASPEKIKIELRTARKMQAIIDYLIEHGLQHKELLIYDAESDPDPNSLRKTPYTLIEIPSLKKHINVCNQINEVTLVALSLLPIHFWENKTKEELLLLPDVFPVVYTPKSENWLAKIGALIFRGDNVERRPIVRVKASRIIEAPLHSEQQIIRWMLLFREKWEEDQPGSGGKWPSALDKDVWEKVDRKWFKLRDENWCAITRCLEIGTRGLEGGSSLYQLREKYGLNERLTRDKIIRLIRYFVEKERRPPVVLDKKVWDKDENGRWVRLENKTWGQIDLAMKRGYRGKLYDLEPGLSLDQTWNLIKDDPDIIIYLRTNKGARKPKSRRKKSQIVLDPD